MRFRLDNWSKKAVLAAPLVVAAVLFLTPAVRTLQASFLRKSTDPNDLVRATRLEPGNSEWWYRVARYQAFVVSDPNAAVTSYQHAVAANPNVAQYWLELGDAYAVTSQPRKQVDALRKAVQLDPTSPEIAWEAGNYFLVTGDTAAAMRSFRTVLEANPEQARAIAQLCFRTTGSVDQVLDNVLPSTPEAHLQFLDLLVDANDSPAAGRVWSRLMLLDRSFEPQRAFKYIQYLLDRKDIERARERWLELVRGSRSLAQYAPSTNNLVVNGGFDLPILNGGFDWHYQQVTNASISVDSMQFNSAPYSLLITFNGNGVHNAGVWQLVPVDPNSEYVFSAYTRSEDLLSANGPHLQVSDAESGEQLWLGDEITASHPWGQSTGEFHTGDQTRLVKIEVVRIPDPRLTDRAWGKLWLDDVRLVKK